MVSLGLVLILTAYIHFFAFLKIIRNHVIHVCFEVGSTDRINFDSKQFLRRDQNILPQILIRNNKLRFSFNVRQLETDIINPSEKTDRGSWAFLEFRQERISETSPS